MKQSFKYKLHIFKEIIYQSSIFVSPNTKNLAKISPKQRLKMIKYSFCSEIKHFETRYKIVLFL